MTNEINYDEPPELTRQQLADLAKLAVLQKERGDAVAEAEADLKLAKKLLSRVEDVELPDAMAAIGMVDFTLADGTGIKIKETLYASIPAKNKKQAGQWLVNNGMGALVKEAITIPFDKGEDEKVLIMSRLLVDIGAVFSVIETINTASVKAMINERDKEGLDTPMGLFGAYKRKVAIVKRS